MPSRKRCWLSAENGLYAGLSALVGLGLFNGTFAPPVTDAGQLVATSPAPSTAGHPLDEPLRVLARARQAFASVQDYTCTMIKQERIGGQLQPVNVVSIAIRSEPFSVYMKWMQPRNAVGQEACYVAGKNGGKMRAKSPGLLGKVGFVSIDPNDPRAKKTSNHSIVEAGIGNVLMRLHDSWGAERKLNRVQVKMGDYEYNKRRCTRVEAIRTQLDPNSDDVYRSVVYFDKELALPIRVEIYGRPQPGAKPGSDIIEVFSYIDLKLNVGLTDAMFDR